MPRTKPLTRKQAQEKELQRVSDGILAILGAKRGQEDLKYKEFAEKIGLTPQQYRYWRERGVGPARLDTIVMCLMNAGYTLEFVPTGHKHNAEENKRETYA